LPLLERVRVEVYIPDPSQLKYEKLLLSPRYLAERPSSYFAPFVPLCGSNRA